MKAFKNQQQSTENNLTRLPVIKLVHTLIGLLFNSIIFYLFYAVVTSQIDKWVWMSIGLFALERIILPAFGLKCTLTVMAKKYSTSTKDNFDIFLPNWLAGYTKIKYTAFPAFVLIIPAYQPIKK